MSQKNRKSLEKETVRIGLIAVSLASLVALFVLVVSIPSTGLSQQVQDAPEVRTIDEKTRAEIVDSVTTTLNNIYVFPDVAKEMEKYVLKQMKQGKYDTLTNAATFAEVLTEDLREICHDLHLRVGYAPDEFFEREESDTLTDDARKEMQRQRAYENYGFHKVERLSGNIGYLDLRQFADARWGGETAVAAMNFLANSGALIIDLRQNGGGSPSMIQLISSYFFDEPVHLNSFYIRAEDTIQQFWTAAYVEGKRMTDTDLYVLTSSRTFSAAEEFTYNMKNMERATIIGETTGGGAHPVDRYGFKNLNIAMSVPFGRAINPITGTNWEGAGITPHIEVPQAQALTVARKEAMTKMLEESPDNEYSEMLKWNLATLDAELNPITVDEAILKKFVGVYGPRTITFEHGELYYQREERQKYRMIPMSEDTFMFEEIDYFRLQVILDENGNPTELHGLYDNGHIDVSARTGN
ncbi:MAG: S41 family peptidase [candidate division Zixibacteria bacterium]|nr:S41 family peptidase [candidate division Zixibacteria bacterium]